MGQNRLFHVRRRPLLALTLGDPAGIGPEVVLKALDRGRVLAFCRPVVVGARPYLEDCAERLGLRPKLRRLSSADGARGRAGEVDLVEVDEGSVRPVELGMASAAGGRASMAFLERGVRLCVEGCVEGLVTAPINKVACRKAGYSGAGHLEFIGKATGAASIATLLGSRFMRVVHLTTHLPLSRACELVTKRRILSRLRLIQASWTRWGLPEPRIGVAALNPHGSDGGLFGDEEAREIAPAVARARREGIDAHGPVPADSLYPQAARGDWDVVLALYHDQGHIAIKTHGMDCSYSLALGLPMVRTSVDHGTAYDIAGKGLADPLSLEVACAVAAEIVLRSRGEMARGEPSYFVGRTLPVFEEL